MPIARIARNALTLLVAACVLSLMMPFYAGIAQAEEAGTQAEALKDLGSAATGTSSIDDDAIQAQAAANATKVTLAGFKYNQAEVRTMLGLVNQFRTSSSWQWDEKGNKVNVAAMPALKLDTKLEQIAMQRAAECAIRYSHTRPDDSSLVTAFEEAGFSGSFGENIAAGQETIQEMFDAWKEEDKDYAGQGHRRNMQTREFKAIGLACAEVNGVKFWVMELGDTSSITTPGAAFSGTRSVTMSILNSRMTRSDLKVSQSSLLLLVGETAKLPTVSSTCSVKTENVGPGNYWNFSKASFSEAITPSWSVTSSYVASLANGSVRGALPGTTTLTASAGGRTAKVTVTVKEDKPEVMYRLYNPNSGEHFYTASGAERNNLVKVGWKYEGEGWKAPAKSGTPVYRLYSGTDHHYTTSAGERDSLVKAGWKYEGIGWYSDDNKGVPLHRVFNPNVNPKAARNNSGSHHYTTSAGEYNQLCKIGWNGEGVGWYGCK